MSSTSAPTRDDGNPLLGRVDPDLFDAEAGPNRQPVRASRRQAEPSYKRLAGRSPCPAGGATLSFWIDARHRAGLGLRLRRGAHRRPGRLDDPARRPERAHQPGHRASSARTGSALHPFLAHYQTDNGDGTCSPAGTTGDWNAATGSSGGYEQWSSTSRPTPAATSRSPSRYASDDADPAARRRSSTTSSSPPGRARPRSRTTANTFDGWTVPGAPAGSAPNDERLDRRHRGRHAAAARVSRRAARSPGSPRSSSSCRARSAATRSRRPAASSTTPDIGFALENQTRPIYSKGFFTDPVAGDFVVVHELAHQWFGDSLAVAQWQHIWLNEGFATYAEWLWSRARGLRDGAGDLRLLLLRHPRGRSRSGR